MDEKIKLMSRYKIVLAFENNNVSDYVTETVFNALQAGIKYSKKGGRGRKRRRKANYFWITAYLLERQI
jgi:hypothetical protein